VEGITSAMIESGCDNDCIVRELAEGAFSAFVGTVGDSFWVSGVCARPLKTINSSEEAPEEAEATERAGEGLRIVIWARAAVATGL
jgi:hypothetical protein